MAADSSTQIITSLYTNLLNDLKQVGKGNLSVLRQGSDRLAELAGADFPDLNGDGRKAGK